MATINLPVPPLLSATTATPDGGPPTIKHPSDTSSLKLCNNMDEIKQLHAYFTKTKSLTPTKLVSACAEIATPESLEYARKAFNIFITDEKNPDTIYGLNCLIRGYAFAGLCDEAIMLYFQLVNKGISPDNFTFPFVLSACTKGVAFLEGVQIHGSIVKLGLEEDVFIQNSLIHFYCECGELDKGRMVFDKMHERNVVSWTSLICGYARRGRSKEAVYLFFDMVEVGIIPNSVTMVCVVSGCAKLADLGLGERVCGYIGLLGAKVNVVLVNAVVDMYMKCGANDKAKQLFDECGDRNVVLYNTILSNYVQQGMVEETLHMLSEMLRQGLRPDRVTVLSAISASAEMGNLLLGKQCHCYALRNGFEGWESVSNALIDMYMKCGKQILGCKVFDKMLNKSIVSWNTIIAGLARNDDVKSAREIFDEMPERDLISWNTMIDALVQESLFEDAIELFRAMQRGGMKADRVTMVSIASACGYLGAIDLARWTYSYIERNKIVCDMKLSTALVDLFARCGDSQSAMEVFEKMKERDVSAWTAAIGAMAMEGNGKRAVELFYEMLRQAVKPDEVVFVGVLTACSHGGLVQQGKDIFKAMEKNHGISPQIVHYGCVVDLLGRGGYLSEALDLIKSMPMEANDAIWGAFLAACRKHKNDKLAAYAAEMMGESANERTGICVLLSNIYASVGNWNDVAKVRLSMKEKGVRKIPGSSSIEVNGMIHEFTSGNEPHPGKNLIPPMLDEINCRLKDVGHVPDTSNVLLDVDELEKEYLLSQHSEKLAIAFGLIGTSQGIPIRVVKNLRMCSDCHSFAKLVSDVYDREIVVRDNNRFHFFHGGVCSCNDYW